MLLRESDFPVRDMTSDEITSFVRCFSSSDVNGRPGGLIMTNLFQRQLEAQPFTQAYLDSGLRATSELIASQEDDLANAYTAGVFSLFAAHQFIHHAFNNWQGIEEAAIKLSQNDSFDFFTNSNEIMDELPTFDSFVTQMAHAFQVKPQELTATRVAAGASRNLLVEASRRQVESALDNFENDPGLADVRQLFAGF